MFNVQKLQKEIDAAGIPNDGVSADGVISFKEGATAQHRAAADAIKAAHDPTDTSGALREAARQAFRSTDWQGELDDINAGKALVAQMTATVAPGRALVTAIRGDAAIPAATRTRIADAMDGLITNQVTTATILNALINKHHQNGTWWWTLMRLMTLSDE